MTTATLPALDLQGVSAGYGGRTVIRDIDLRVDEGAFFGLIGPNGAGKSTLFKTALGLLKPLAGDVRIFGHPVSQARNLIGYMPQMELVDWDFPVTVGDVALMGRYGGLGLIRRPTKVDKEAAEEALETVGMADLHSTLIGELSGGQRRRVLLARALANKPRLLVLDEPMAGLDTTAQHQILNVLHGFTAHGQGMSVLMSTHDLSCVSTLCDGICCLRGGDVYALGTPEEVLTEDILSEAFGKHLLMVHVDGKAYAAQHHVHKDDEGGKAYAVSRHHIHSGHDHDGEHERR